MLYFWGKKKKQNKKPLYFAISLVGNAEKRWVFICLFKWWLSCWRGTFLNLDGTNPTSLSAEYLVRDVRHY